MNQIEFQNTIKEFHTIEDARDQLWDRAINLINKGFEIEAYILILATWNFAYFRYFMKEFDLREFKNVIKNIKPVFKKLEGKRFEMVDFTDKPLISDIKFIYTQLKKIAAQTGASKIMALKNPELFVMWDTEIRKMYKINNRAYADDYISFLINMREEFVLAPNIVGQKTKNSLGVINFAHHDKNKEKIYT